MILRPINRQAKEELHKAVSIFEDALPGSPGEEYLNARGIGPKTAKRMRLGYVDPAAPVDGWDRFGHRICVPNLNAHGDPIWAKFRAVNPDAKLKYTQQEGAQSRLFNTLALSAPSDTIILVEGEFDVLTLTAMGLPAVGVPGASKFKTHWKRCFDGYNRIVMFYDDDEPGRDLVKKVKEQLPDVIPIAAPMGCNDINEAYLAGHRETIRSLALGLENHHDDNTRSPDGPDATPPPF